MKSVVLVSGMWLALVVAGVVSYLVYTKWMPESLKGVLSGWKTKILGIIIAVSPDLINLLTFLQVIGQDWLPTDNTAWILRGIGTSITVLRYITDHESST